MVRFILAIIGVSFLAPSVLAQDWPHWRGSRSKGVGIVSRAPERWSPTESVLWRAEVEGSGISSPVIVGHRVYLTTAISSQQRTALRLACDSLTGFLTFVGIPALVRYRWKLGRTNTSAASLSRLYGAVQVVDLGVFVLLAITILGFGALIAIGPAAVDAGLSSAKDIGIELARSLGRQHTNLSFLEWERTRHNTWIISSAMALASFALIPFLFPAYSIIRVVGTVALFGGVALAIAHVPWTTAYGDRYPTGALIALYSPVVALTAWHLLVSGVGGVRAVGNVGALTAKGSRLITLVPAVLSLALFAPPNYLSQHEVLTRRLVCLDTATGKRVWHTDVFTTPPETKSALNSHATPTPSVVNDTVVVAFGPGVAAVGLDGQLRWSKTFPNWMKGSIYGAASSPVADGEAIFVTYDREFEAPQPSRVIAYSLITGNELWSYTPGFAHDGYATPVIYDDGDRKLLLTSTFKTLVGYDIVSGRVAWRVTTPVGQPVPSLIADGHRLYVTGGKGGGNGYTAAYQLRQNSAPEQLWENLRNPADVSSPVLYKERLYTISSAGVMVCYDAGSGTVIWRKRLGSGLGQFYASLVAADDKVYAVRSNGTTFVIAAEDKFRLISESSLPEDIYASPAFADDCLFLRTIAAVYCIGNKD
jgi:outer membrane protein assembly factor BamB